MSSYHALTEELPDRVTDGWFFWPGVIFVNLCYVNPLFRTAYINFWAMFWNVYQADKRHHPETEKVNSEKNELSKVENVNSASISSSGTTTEQDSAT